MLDQCNKIKIPFLKHWFWKKDLRLAGIQIMTEYWTTKYKKLMKIYYIKVDKEMSSYCDNLDRFFPPHLTDWVLLCLHHIYLR